MSVLTQLLFLEAIPQHLERKFSRHRDCPQLEHREAFQGQLQKVLVYD
jgi:hypothetical protein